jgi:hypothetical protein
MKVGFVLLRVFALLSIVECFTEDNVTGRRLFRRGTHESTIESPEGTFAKKRAVSDSMKPRGKHGGKQALAGQWGKPKASSDPTFNRHGSRSNSRGNSNPTPRVKEHKK